LLIAQNFKIKAEPFCVSPILDNFNIDLRKFVLNQNICYDDINNINRTNDISNMNNIDLVNYAQLLELDIYIPYVKDPILDQSQHQSDYQTLSQNSHENTTNANNIKNIESPENNAYTNKILTNQPDIKIEDLLQIQEIHAVGAYMKSSINIDVLKKIIKAVLQEMIENSQINLLTNHLSDSQKILLKKRLFEALQNHG
jgi:hypothetical protein